MEVKRELMEKIVNYLATKPWMEVVTLINEIQAAANVQPEPAKEGEEDA